MSSRPAVADDPAKILVFAYMGLGDAFMFQPTFRALLSRYPQAKVSIISGVRSPVIEVLRRTAGSLGRELDAVYEANYKELSPAERRSLNSLIVMEGYDMVVCTYMTPVPYFTRAISASPIRVGHTIPEKWYKPRPNAIFNISIALEQDKTHETERHARLAIALGIEVTDRSSALPLDDAELSFAEEFWREHQLHDARVIGTHFGASKIQNWKRWNDEGFDETLSRIADENSSVLLFGLEEERDGILASSRTARSQTIDLIGKLSIFQVAALLAKCDIMLANDSGLGHVAIAVGIPAVRVFGMSDYWGYRSLQFPQRDVWIGIECSPCLQLGYLKPYNVHNCGHRNCMNLVTPEMVTETFRAAAKKK